MTERPEAAIGRLRSARGMEPYVKSVRSTWERAWKGKDHRYGRDFYAFLGERIFTDFQLDRTIGEPPVQESE